MKTGPERIVEKEVPVERVVTVERVVEKEVPVEKVITVEKLVHVPGMSYNALAHSTPQSVRLLFI